MTTPFTFLADAFDAPARASSASGPAPPRTSASRRSSCPTTSSPSSAPMPYLATVAALDRAHPDQRVRPQQRPAPSRRCSPRTSPRSTSCPEGRLDVAIGAGWNEPEYDAIGLPFDPVRVRQARLAEAIDGPQGLLRRRAVLVRRRALHDHRLRRAAEAGPAAAPAVLHRRRRPDDAGAGRARGGHRRAGAADPARAAGRPAVDHLGGDRGEDRLGPRGGRRPVRRADVQRLPVALADHRHRRPPRRGRARSSTG